MNSGADAAALERLVPQDAAERAHVDLPLAQRLLGVDRRHHDQLDLLDLARRSGRCASGTSSSTASWCAPRVLTPIFLPIRSRGPLDRAVVGHVEADVAVLVDAVVADHRLDRAPGRDELDDGAVEGAAEVGLPVAADWMSCGPLMVLPIHFELDVAEVAEVLGELGRR